LIPKGHLDRTMINEYLPQMYKRCNQMCLDFRAAHSVINEVTSSLTDQEVLKNYQNELLGRIQVITLKSIPRYCDNRRKLCQLLIINILLSIIFQ
jgi:hypothetical protein